MAKETVQTNEGELPSSTATEQVAVSNVSPSGVDVGTNAIELRDNPNPSRVVDEGTPASAIVQNDTTLDVDPNRVTGNGRRIEIQGDYVVHHLPNNGNGDSPLDDEAAGGDNSFPPGASEGEEYTQTTATPTNDFQAVVTEEEATPETELKKPRRFSRT